MLKWNINSKSLEFTDLGPIERAELLDLCKKKSRHGSYIQAHPAFRAWVQGTKYEKELRENPGYEHLVEASFLEKALLSIAVSEETRCFRKAPCVRAQEGDILKKGETYWIFYEAYMYMVYTQDGGFVGYASPSYFSEA